MTTVTCPFIDQLAKSRVLPENRVREISMLSERLSQPTSVDVAMAAVRHGFLTRFQAEEILNNRGRRLCVGDYVIFEVLGYGGMGTVYFGYHQETHERVAIKLLGDQHKHDAGMRSRFRLEATAGIQFSHPRLVKTLELGVLQDLYGDTDYMVMELVEGVTLLEAIAFCRGTMKHDAACDVVCQAAEGLEYLHNQGMVHRDVKPDNILIQVDGEAKLLDFGLALADQSETAEEFSLAMIFGHDCLGTADFIAPEQSLDSLNVDHRADIYSLGCTLYVALTAKRPFPGDSRIKTVQAHRTLPRPLVSDLNESVPKELSAVVRQMMSVDPNDRLQSMADVRSALAPFRRHRGWNFQFDQVLARRVKQKRKNATPSRPQGSTATRSTEVGAHAETDSPHRRPVTGDDELVDESF